MQDETPSDAPKWIMRFRFRASHTLHSAEEKYEFQLGGREVVLKSRTGGKLNETNEYALVAEGFLSEDEAREFGERVRHALLHVSVCSPIGVDIGNDKPTAVFAESVKQKIMAECGAALRDDIHGLKVYPEEPPPMFVLPQASISVSEPLDRFTEFFQEAFTKKGTVFDKSKLAVDLYCASKMERSHRAKLILALNVIEDLASRVKRPPEEVDFINDTIKRLDCCSLGKQSKEALRNALGNLKRVSIGKAGRDLIERLLGSEAVVEYQRLSEVRGAVAHPSPTQLERLPDEAEKARDLAQRVLKKLLGD